MEKINYTSALEFLLNFALNLNNHYFYTWSQQNPLTCLSVPNSIAEYEDSLGASGCGCDWGLECVAVKFDAGTSERLSAEGCRVSSQFGVGDDRPLPTLSLESAPWRTVNTIFNSFKKI